MNKSAKMFVFRKARLVCYTLLRAITSSATFLRCKCKIIKLNAMLIVFVMHHLPVRLYNIHVRLREKTRFIYNFRAIITNRTLRAVLCSEENRKGRGGGI